MSFGLSQGSIKEIRRPESIHWLTIDITSGKNWNSEGRMVLSGRKEWGRKEVERVIIEKTKALLSGLWQHPLHQVSPPPSLPSELPIQFHPHGGISSTAPSLIYPSIHLSLPQQMGKITPNNATTNSPPSSPPPSYIQISAPLKSVPVVEKDTSESLKECKWRFFGAREFRTVQMSDLVSAGVALR